MDVVDSATRSRMMSAIKGKNTRPELLVRKFLHAHGFRFRLHRKDLPGNPDIVMPKLKTCIFVHGCFWHRHAGCRYATMPKTRPLFWAEKFAKNVKRDLQSSLTLQQSGWRVITIWECQLKDPKPVMSALINQLNESQNL
ncbi:very short patch repair endonuclease [Pseudomonas sp. CDFA 610]|uniref:very short patch repair endonuclease n=1 Tax=Pseudomonas sp. CDFA 610 TaxID=2829825 RepID=UPI001E381B10|nr:very short patch repair endonuclease [Pseudomonas sp. CDFA 610]MCD5985098.1 DNA mismatch endonuclease Vsr [Pseudomonas sp. CDFA 610]MEE4634942.1 very short patch repair endonuclease [Pseudomonas alliivorans]